MAVRTACKLVRAQWRTLNPNEEDCFSDVVVQFLNKLLGDQVSSIDYWNTEFKLQIEKRFELPGGYPCQIREEVNLQKLFDLSSAKLGLKWSESAIKNLLSAKSYPLVLQKSEILGLGTTLKYTSVVPFVETFVETLRLMGRYNEVEAFYKQQLNIRESRLGHHHVCVAVTLQNLAELYSFEGKYQQAKQHYKRMLTIVKDKRGVEHPDYATGITQLGEFYFQYGKYKKAEPLLLRALEIRLNNQTNNNPLDTAVNLEKLAKLKRVQGKYEDAEKLAKSSLELYNKCLTSGEIFLQILY